MRNFKLAIILLLISIGFSGVAQEIIPPNKNGIKYFNKETKIPAYERLSTGMNLQTDQFFSWLSTKYQVNQAIGFLFKKTEPDQIGMLHSKYQQTYNNIPIEFATYTIHSRNNQVVSVSGVAFEQVRILNSYSLTEQQALNYALSFIDAETFMWQIPSEEANIKEFTNNPQATYYPKGELVLINPEQNFKSPNLKYAWKFDIYASQPLSRAWYYIDAENGQLIFTNNQIQETDVKGVAHTKYSGIRDITTDSVSSGNYRLREATRGNGIETYNMLKGTNYGSAIDFTDNDNDWNNINSNLDEVATDAHWGTEMTYDYYMQTFNRNSIDGNGFKLRSYVHFSTNYANAFWNGAYMTYGDGNGSSAPLVALDIIGHEITHGLTSNTANLVYASQSGALSEGVSDIFGNMIEYFAKPADASWEIGEDINVVIRNMKNPNAKSDPDTYRGLYFIETDGCVPSEANDKCGVHTNSAIPGFWFYLLVEGGSGTNDLNNKYSVQALGIEKASAIAFRMLTVYLPSSATFEDARIYSTIAAQDLYGECSDEATQVMKAWYAVGVGGDGRAIGFAASKTSSCTVPFTVEFSNFSDAYTSYIWDFGDGNISTDLNPVHTYITYGKFTVSLIALSTCQTDTLVKTNLIEADINTPCLFMMSKSGLTDTIKVCKGRLLDDGGEENYTGNLDVQVVIAPPGASSISLVFKSFAMEGDCDCDWLYIYDGIGSGSPLIGKYSGFDLPNGGVITSTTGAITIRQYTDPLQTYSGFDLTWYYSTPNSPPKSLFNAEVISSCNGIVKFKSLTTNNPDSLFWDFGDGTYSNTQNPTHIYKESGIYSVKLTAKNKFGTDYLIRNNLIVIDRPEPPLVEVQESCGPKSFTIIADGVRTVKWYYNEDDTLPFYIGDTLLTEVIEKTKSVYVVDDLSGEPKRFGPKDNTIGTGGNFTGNQSMTFDVNRPCVLKSVKVYATGTSERTIILRDKDQNLINQIKVMIPSGESRINPNLELPVMKDLRLGTSTSPNLYRNNSGASYPYELDSTIAITGTTAGSSGYYYYFYDWEIQDPQCSSAKKEVILWIDSIPKADFKINTNILTCSFNDLSAFGRNHSWSFGDGTFSNEVNPVHTYSITGTYEVKLFIQNACGIDSVIKQISVTSINDNSGENEVKIYPVPARNSVFISFQNNNSEKIEIKLINVYGQIVQLKTVSAFENNYTEEININNLEKGIYFVQLIWPNKFITQRIVVE